MKLRADQRPRDVRAAEGKIYCAAVIDAHSRAMITTRDVSGKPGQAPDEFDEWYGDSPELCYLVWIGRVGTFRRGQPPRAETVELSTSQFTKPVMTSNWPTTVVPSDW